MNYNNTLTIKIDRKWKKEDYTIGRLYINNTFFSNTLEDTDRGLVSSMSLDEIKKIKIQDQTCIPAGEYDIMMTYSPKFKRELPLVLGVKGFSGIRIHPGNTNRDTSGCILVGMNTKVGVVTDSRLWTDRLIGIIRECMSNGGVVKLKIE